MRPKLLWPVSNLIALSATIAVNGLANALPFNGVTTGDVINRDPVAFLPAAWVFSIWGVIYVALVAFVAYSFVLARRGAAILGRISALFILSCIANSLWLVCWHWGNFPLSMLLMLVLLGALIAIYGIVHTGETRAALSARLCLALPFSIYLGWISVATISNAAVVLHHAGWDGGGIAQTTWAAIMVVVGGGLATGIGWRFADAAFAAVFTWAFVGLAIRQSDARQLATTAWIVALVALVVAGSALLRSARANGVPRLRADPGNVSS